MLMQLVQVHLERVSMNPVVRGGRGTIRGPLHLALDIPIRIHLWMIYQIFLLMICCIATNWPLLQ